MAIDSLRNSRPVITPVSHSSREREKQNNKNKGKQMLEKRVSPKPPKSHDGDVHHVDELV